MITLYCEFTAQPGFDTIDRILDHYRRSLRIDLCRGDLVYRPSILETVDKGIPCERQSVVANV